MKLLTNLKLLLEAAAELGVMVNHSMSRAKCRVLIAEVSLDDNGQDLPLGESKSHSL